MNELRYILYLLATKGIGVQIAQRVRAIQPDFTVASQLTVAELMSCGTSADAAAAFLDSLRTLRHEGLVQRVVEAGVSYVTDNDPSYPPLLREIAVPPPVLFYRGVLPSAPCMAIVGTRKCTAYGKKVAEDIGADLAHDGICVVSGLAYGIDHAAHAGCVASGGRTVAVLGSGILQVYPQRHEALAERIVATGGALVSEYWPWALPARHTFPERNRIISGLSRGVVIVEAAIHSGALITAAFAVAQNRDVFVIPGSIYSQASEGVHALMTDGAGPITSVRGVWRQLYGGDSGHTPAHAASSEPNGGCHSLLGQRLLDEVATGPRSIADLQRVVEATGITTSEFTVEVTRLEVSGHLVRDAAGYLFLGSKRGNGV